VPSNLCRCSSDDTLCEIAPNEVIVALQDSQTARERRFSEHVIFVLCAGNYKQDIGLVNFVRPLRTSSLLTHRLQDIVFYTDSSLVEAEWKTIANFPRLFVYPVTIFALF